LVLSTIATNRSAPSRSDHAFNFDFKICGVTPELISRKNFGNDGFALSRRLVACAANTKTEITYTFGIFGARTVAVVVVYSNQEISISISF
jgi:hypothetical protein